MQRQGICLAAMLLAWHAAAPAQQDPDYGTLVLEYENDLFAGEDRYYTSGVRATWISPDERIPGWVQSGSELVPFFDRRGSRKLSYSLGQNMYTPEDITDGDPSEDDRPYAGWLYFAVSLASETRERVDRLQLSLGVVGPASLADKTQAEIHRFVGSDRPEGWHTQLRNEPALLVGYERQWRTFAGMGDTGWAWDLTPSAGGAVGNVFTQANLGLTLRAGRHLPLDWGPPRIQPTLPGSGVFRPRASFGWYFFVSADGRAVARDVFLDGNSFRNSRSVDKKPLVGEIQVGAAANIGRRVRVSYTHVYSTREFESQSESQEFGTMALSVLF